MNTNLAPTEKEQADIVIISNLHDSLKAMTEYAQATDSRLNANLLTENIHSLTEKVEAYNNLCRQYIYFNSRIHIAAAIVAMISKGIASGLHWGVIFQKARGAANDVICCGNPFDRFADNLTPRVRPHLDLKIEGNQSIGSEVAE